MAGFNAVEDARGDTALTYFEYGTLCTLWAFQQAGLDNVLSSWLGSGPNQAISGDQLSNVLGSGPLGQIAAQLGVGPGAAAGQLAQVLPGLVDQLSPKGEAPQGGFGNASDLLGMLGGLLQK